jgi:kynurenine formamidase
MWQWKDQLHAGIQGQGGLRNMNITSFGTGILDYLDTVEGPAAMLDIKLNQIHSLPLWRLNRIRPLLLLGFVLATTAAADETRWIDLTHDLSSEAVFWPTAKPFEMTTDFEGKTEKGYYYSAYSFCTAEHGGTHIDAPVHFAEGGHSVDKIPLEQLIGNAAVVDVTAAVARNRDYLIGIEDFSRWETEHGKIPDGSIVLLRTGFGAYWPQASKYLGTGLRGQDGVAALSFPGLSAAAAAWLIEARGIKAVGIDTASIDFGKSTEFAAHVALMTHNVPAFENVANLELLPATGAYVIALPTKLRGGSGGPLRIIARIGGD